MTASEQDCLDLIVRMETLFPRATNGYDVFSDENGFAVFLVCNDDPTDELKERLDCIVAPNWNAAKGRCCRADTKYCRG